MSDEWTTCRFERCDCFNEATGRIEPLPPYQPCAFCMAYGQRCPCCKRQDLEQAAIDRIEEERKL